MSFSVPYSNLNDNSHNYFVYLIEDRYGSVVEFANLKPEIIVNIRDQGSDELAEEIHSMCMGVMMSIMSNFGIFIPFKLYNSSGDLVTFETYFSDPNVSTSANDIYFNFGEDVDFDEFVG